jgi:DNA-directed RNA polymerase specialized sigma24 family protein
MQEPTRTIFRLRRIDQLPQREIAGRLGMPESTVEKHVMRALLLWNGPPQLSGVGYDAGA